MLPPLIFFFLVFLFPVAVYLTVLAGINRRDNPVMIPGTWDAAGLLFATSGFLLAAGPAILASTYDVANHSFFSESAFAWLMRNLLSQWWFFWGVYYLGVVGGAMLFLWWRRRSTVIYNIEPTVFDTVLTQTLERLELNWHRRGDRVFLSGARGLRQHSLDSSSTGILAEGEILKKPTGEANGPPGGDLTMKIDPFPLFCNVTISWPRKAGYLREEVEREFYKALTQVQTRSNPSAGWLLGVSGALFGVMLIVTLFLLALMFLMRAR